MSGFDVKGENTVKLRRIVVLLCAVLMLSSFTLGKSSSTVLKVKIEATELDKVMLLGKLQSHGEDNGLQFEAVEKDYDYRIVFATGQHMGGSGKNFSVAGADVFDAAGKEIFKFERKHRVTDEGATNAVAKEIIKRLLKWRALSHAN
ncbi:MAG: hypothetical protein CXZ00_02530 [Acidobacteria bacterium]|nr:MAG: hypothetical protein CXZ00_02530 [Acidobacteriota bacterium]